MRKIANNAVKSKTFKSIIKIIMCILSIFMIIQVGLFFIFPENSVKDADALSSGTTYYKNGTSYYTLSSSVQHYRCTNSSHSGSNDYTTSSVSGTCYSTSGYYYTCGSCSGSGTRTTSTTCSSCSGSGSKSEKTTCTTCSGSGHVTCSSCSGTGKKITGYGSHDITWNLRCKHCGKLFANGVTTGGSCGSNPQYGSCGSCNSSGNRRCSNCSGNGYKYKTVSCTSCGGDGKVTSSTTCSSCSGSGRKWSSGSSYRHSISKSYVLYTYMNIDTGTTTTSQSAFSTASGYTVTYNANGGSGSMSSQYFLHGHAQTLSNNAFTRSNYQFLGWSTSNTATTATYTNGQSVTSVTTGSSVTLYAVWKLLAFTVSFDNQNATTAGSASVTATNGQAMPTITVPTKTGYTFGGYFTGTNGSGTQYYNSSGTSARTCDLTGATTLYAKWTANTYTIAYDGNGSTGGSTASSSHTYDSASTLTANGYTKTGYHFAGWATSSTGAVAYGDGASVSNLSSTNGATVTLYAKWTANTYSVKYNGNGATGGSTASSSHTYGVSKALTANGFSKTGYNFAGWATSSAGAVAYSDGASVSNLSSTNGATVTLYAKWTANGYTVKYDGNGATGGSTASSSHTYGTSKALTTNGFTKTGYHFAGWATSSTGGVTYANGASVRNLSSTNGATVTLYAKWTANTYSVKYNGNGNTGGSMDNSSHTYDTAKALTSNAYSKTGYHFAGWATSSTGSVAYTNGANVTNLTSTNGGTVNLYAKWTANTYTVKYNGNGNTGGSMANSSHTYDRAKALTANTFTKTGHSFAGWATSSSGVIVFKDAESVTNLTSTNGGTVNLYAVWHINNYQLSINPNGGSIASDSMINLSGLQHSIVARTSGGHNISMDYEASTGVWTFTNTDSADPYITLQFTASLTANTTYNMHVTLTNASGALITKTNAAQMFYAINGGYVEAQSKRFTGNATFSFTPTTTGTYSFRFDNDTGATIRMSDVFIYTTTRTSTYATTIPYNYYYQLPVPTRTGYTFDGWTASGLESISGNVAYMGPSNASVTAKWVANEYEVRFETDGKAVASSKIVKYDSAYGTLPAPTNADYVFEGWYLESTFKTPVNATTTVKTAGNHTLYAKWKNNSVSVYANIGGEVRLTGFDKTDTSNTVTIEAIAYDGYKFASWSLSDGTDMSSYTSAKITVDYSMLLSKTIIANFANISDDSSTGEFGGAGNEIVVTVHHGGAVRALGYSGTDANATARYAIKYVDPDYEFVGWRLYDDDTIISREETVEFSVLEYKGKIILADFRPKSENDNYNMDLNN